MPVSFDGDVCGTAGCTNPTLGIPISISRPSIYRCRECIICLDALAPRWVPGFTNSAAYDARNHELGHLDSATLREQAAEYLARIDQAREAFTMLADLVGPDLAHDTVAAILGAGDRVIPTTVSNWRDAHRWPEHHPATAPAPRGVRVRSRVRVTVDGLGVGTVRLVPALPGARYRARRLADGTLRPDLPLAKEPLYATPHQAAAALAAWAGRVNPPPLVRRWECGRRHATRPAPPVKAPPRPGPLSPASGGP